MSETKEKTPFWRQLFFSQTLLKKGKSYQIAYIALATAFCVVSNLFLEFKLMDTQFSVTIAASALAGLLIGPIFGFCAAFLGDLIGFLGNTGGFMYMPWVGLALGATAFFAGFLFNLLPFRFKGGVYCKLAAVCLTSFFISTIAINTTAFWLLYAKGVPYFTYLFSRLILRGQIFNCLFNYALLFIALPVLSAIKPLKLEIR